MVTTKPFLISKHLVWNAYKKVKGNKGSAGIDEQSIEDFEKDMKKNLYKIGIGCHQEVASLHQY